MLLGQYIYNEFIEGDRQVNISARAVNRLKEAITKAKENEDALAKLDGHVFDKVLNEVLKLMDQGSFSRFKKSDLFREFIIELGLKHTSIKGVHVGLGV